jgi:hypothetical protein
MLSLVLSLVCCCPSAFAAGESIKTRRNAESTDASQRALLPKFEFEYTSCERGKCPEFDRFNAVRMIGADYGGIGLSRCGRQFAASSHRSRSISAVVRL